MHELFRHDADIRIQELTVENPTPPAISPFNLERDLPPSEQQKIIEGLTADNGSRQNEEYRDDLMRAVVLFPEQRAGLPLTLRLRHEMLRDLKALEESERGLGSHDIRLIQNCRILFPDLTDFNVLFEKMAERIIQRIDQKDRDYAFMSIAAANIAFPGRLNEVFERDWQYYLSRLDASKNDFQAAQTLGNFFDYIYSLAHLREAFPGRVGDIQAPSTIWELGARLMQDHAGIWEYTLNLAYVESIVAAERVTVDERGITLTPARPQPEKTAEAPLPEQRKY